MGFRGIVDMNRLSGMSKLLFNKFLVFFDCNGFDAEEAWRFQVREENRHAKSVYPTLRRIRHVYIPIILACAEVLLRWVDLRYGFP